jgi:eukaryotic-like serine/threonine-protein kinase
VEDDQEEEKSAEEEESSSAGLSSENELLRAVARADGDSSDLLRMPREDRAGTAIGRYRLLRLLGSGGMGAVYAAEDEALGRIVALKLLHQERTNAPERRRRFLREARSASAVKHPNIAAVYDVGVADDELFIAMELCEGVSLRRHIAGGPLSPREVVRIGIEIAEGLTVAHERGIVHRDLKPDNIMIAGTTNGSLKILDFSLAKMLAPSNPSLSSVGAARPVASTEDMTVEGRILGTPSYMSPEQARGLNVAIDPRSDIFSLGVVLYEMATGVRPFRGRTPMETLMAVGTDTPLPAHRRDSRVPATLSQVIERCLEKEPDARWPGAREVAIALRRSETFSARLAAKKKPLLVLSAAIALGLITLPWWSGHTRVVPPHLGDGLRSAMPTATPQTATSEPTAAMIPTNDPPTTLSPSTTAPPPPSPKATTPPKPAPNASGGKPSPSDRPPRDPLDEQK